MSNLRNKLMAMVGVESLDTEVVQEGEVVTQPLDADVQIAVEQELADATTDYEESNRLTREFLEEQQAKEEAKEELITVVEGIEAFFNEEFKPEAFNILMRHANRVAERAGVELPVTVSGMESMSSAEIYLQVRTGLEGFVDTLKGGAETLKKLIIQAYEYMKRVLINFINNFRALENQIKHTQARIRAGVEILDTIQLGAWDRYINLRYNRPFNITDLQPLVVLASEFNNVKLLGAVANNDAECTDTIQLMKQSITKRNLRPIREAHTPTGEGYYYDFGNMRVSISVPKDCSLGEKALHDFRASSKVYREVTKGQEKAVFGSTQAMDQELGKLLTFTKGVITKFNTMSQQLDSERDLLISATKVASGGISASKVGTAAANKRRLISVCEENVLGGCAALHKLVQAHIK